MNNRFEREKTRLIFHSESVRFKYGIKANLNNTIKKQQKQNGVIDYLFVHVARFVLQAGWKKIGRFRFFLIFARLQTGD